MRIGVPREIKVEEYRVGMVPASVRELTAAGHEIFIESGAGAGIGESDAAYQAAGATILEDAAAVFETAELIVKVKEPLPEEFARLTPDHTLFTYLHLAADKKLTEGLMKSGCTAIAYETVTDVDGGLPLLAPMSEVAGRMAVQVGAHYLEKLSGGAGILLGGVPGVAAANVVVIGGGVAGENAARIAMGLESRVTILDINQRRLAELDQHFGGQLNTIHSTVDAIETYVPDADLVVGAVLVAGAAAPKLVRREHVKAMRPGSVMVDIAIDQGGCFETSKPTDHKNPVYIVDKVVHYCVTNMPGAVPRTSAFALNNVTLPFILQLANKGTSQALADNDHLRNGLNIHSGQVTFEAVARDLGLPYTPALEALKR